MSALGRLPEAARDRLADDLEGASNPNLVTAAVVVDQLGDKARLVARFGFGRDWSIRVSDDLGPAWVVRWDHLTLHLRDRGDLALARMVADTRVSIAQELRTMIVEWAIDLGLDRRLFLKAAR